MMPHLAVFFHAKLTGPEFGIDPQFSRQLVAEQMQAFRDCGLAKRAGFLYFGFNEADSKLVDDILPFGSRLEYFPQGRSELPTMHHMQAWCKGHPDWLVLYWHAKGITHPHDPLNRVWRLCLENAVLWHWETCVLALQRGFDCAGAHWLTREKYGPLVKTFFFGGNMFWATASFLNTLPPLKANSTCRDDDFKAELWIGTGRRPRVWEFSSHWPGLAQCSATIGQR